MRFMPNLTAIIATAVFLAAPCALLPAQAKSAKFLQTYCGKCHGNEEQEGDRRFDTLPSRIGSLVELERYQEIVDQLNLLEMPPEDEPQPSDNERSEMIAQLTGKISTAHSEFRSSGGHSVLRRLNAWEYRQTIGDLLGLNVDVWNPAEDFPAEVKVDGFDNNGDGLVTSGMLMDHY